MECEIKISVIMGSFNPVEQYLEKAVSSIIDQSFSDWELLICDDGSAPEKGEIIRRLNKRDKRIRIIKNRDNSGLAYCLNKCIESASGQYIARMDDDDISKPDRLQIQYSFLEKHPEYAWVGTNAVLFDDKGIWGAEKKPEIPEKKDFLPHSPYIHPSVMFRRQILIDENGYFSSSATRRCEDYELFMRLHAKGYRGYNIQEPYLMYREDADSYKRRTVRSRLAEVKIRRQGYKRLGLSGPEVMPYLLRPLGAILIPSGLRRYMK